MNDFIDKRKDNPRKRNMSPKLRFEILRRDGFTCQYCGKTGTEKELEIDHVVPFSKGGTNDEGNLITSCFDCNRGKRDTEIIPSHDITKTTTTKISNKNDPPKFEKEYAVDFDARFPGIIKHWLAHGDILKCGLAIMLQEAIEI